MTISNYFYHGLTKKYIAIFGSIFNKMSIERYGSEGELVQKMPIPIQYGNYQKFLQAISQERKNDKKVAIQLPRMSFEMNNIAYDQTRKLPAIKKIREINPDPGSGGYQYVPAPYNIDFSLYVMTLYEEDAAQIAEQIWPHFKPEYTVTAKMMPNYESIDVPLILNSFSMEDNYEGSFEDRRTIIWTFTFTMKCWFYGPSKTRKVIKFIDVRSRAGMTDDYSVASRVTIQPGLTSDGQSTSKLSDTIPYTDIEIDDNWGIITIFEEDDNG
jgi:hypothetical protein